MLCILAVFIPSFFMQGAPRAMFVPLSLAVGFAMVASYLLSSTFVPVLSVWLLRHVHLDDTRGSRVARGPARMRRRHRAVPLGCEHVRSSVSAAATSGCWRGSIGFRWGLLTAYSCVCAAVIWGLGSRLGTEIFPTVDTGPVPASHAGPGRNATSTGPSRSP